MKKMTVTQVMNSLTSEQYIALLNSCFGELPPEIKNMTDDELLAELMA